MFKLYDGANHESVACRMDRNDCCHLGLFESTYGRGIATILLVWTEPEFGGLWFKSRHVFQVQRHCFLLFRE
jgi:hypothetical protein